jgi:thymidylate synthase (FAD)
MTSDPMNKIAELDEELGLSDYRPKLAVELVDCMGTDMSVVNAARVSFQNIASNYTDEQNSRLIYFLARHNHWSPFAHVSLSLRIHAPIFVARQLAKHQIGLAWNEISRRYVKTQPRIWCPDGFRKSAENVKQGSAEALVENERLVSDYYYATALALRTYQSLIANGACAEQARAVLPQGMMTEWIWSGSLYAFSRVVKQRTTEYAQRETKEIAVQISDICIKQFPISWAALHMT